MLGPRGYWNKQTNGKRLVVNFVVVRMPQLVVVYERGGKRKKEAGQEENTYTAHDATAEQTRNF